MDIKYGYIQGEYKFFYLLNLIDIFDRSIIDYHMGLHCEAKDASALLRKCLIKRNLFEEGAKKHLPGLKNVLLDGSLKVDNNAVERAIKPFVIGRKNFLFANTAK